MLLTKSINGGQSSSTFTTSVVCTHAWCLCYGTGFRQIRLRSYKRDQIVNDCLYVDLDVETLNFDKNLCDVDKVMI